MPKQLLQRDFSSCFSTLQGEEDPPVLQMGLRCPRWLSVTSFPKEEELCNPQEKV